MTEFKKNIIYASLILSPLIIMLISSTIIFGGDRECYLFGKELRSDQHLINKIANIVTRWGNPLAYLVYAFIFIKALQNKNISDQRFVICYILVQLAVALVLVHFFKNFFGMPRPSTNLTEAMPWTFKSMYQSFPSGHTTEIIGAVLPLALWRKSFSKGLICSLWIVAVAYSRVFLGRHYIMDIWGGIALGCFTSLLILYFARKKS